MKDELFGALMVAPHLAPLEATGANENSSAIEGDAVLEEQAAELPRIRVKRAPYQPTEEERELHNATHEPYRAWCEHCVAGRGKIDAHILYDHSQDAVPVFGIDYGYLIGKEDEDKSEQVFDEATGTQKPASPILCGRHNLNRWVVCCMLPCKGTGHPFCVTALFQMIKFFRDKKLIIRSDGEPSIVDLKSAAARRAVATLGVEVPTEETPVGDSGANGLSEEAVRTCKAKVRTLRHATEKLHGCKIGETHNSLPWMCLYAAVTINRARRDVNGRTAWENCRGRQWHQPLIPFGERILWLPVGKKQNKLDDGFQPDESIMVSVRDHKFIILEPIWCR